MQPCPHCGEFIDAYVDPGGGDAQDYIEDCSVCCRPFRVRVERLEGSEDYEVVFSPEI